MSLTARVRLVQRRTTNRRSGATSFWTEERIVKQRRKGKTKGAAAKRGRQKGEGYRDPVKYAHMMERGFHDRAGNWVPGIHFMHKAFTRTWRKAMRVIETDMKSRIEKEMARWAPKGPR